MATAWTKAAELAIKFLDSDKAIGKKSAKKWKHCIESAMKLVFKLFFHDSSKFLAYTLKNHQICQKILTKNEIVYERNLAKLVIYYIYVIVYFFLLQIIVRCNIHN